MPIAIGTMVTVGPGDSGHDGGTAAHIKTFCNVNQRRWLRCLSLVFLWTTLVLALGPGTIMVPREFYSSSSSGAYGRQYLYYYSHSGFGNQLIGLARAAGLAYSTNRTLILPSILPHTGMNSRGAGGGCLPYRNSKEFIRRAKLDVENCMGAPGEHVKFSEVIDTKNLSQTINVPLVDLCEFVEKEPMLTPWYFRRNSTNIPPLIDFEGKCTLNRTRTYSEIVEHFQSMFSKNTVAIIPSAFVIRDVDSKTNAFLQQVFDFPPSSMLSAALRAVRDRMPSKYMGVHLRYKDSRKFICKSENKTVVLDMIRNEHLGAMEESAWKGVPAVFLASNFPKAVQCYKQELRNTEIPTFDTSDFLIGNASLPILLSRIQVPDSTLLLLIDMILVSLGERILFMSERGGGTFQDAIRARQRMKNWLIF